MKTNWFGKGSDVHTPAVSVHKDAPAAMGSSDDISLFWHKALDLNMPHTRLMSYYLLDTSEFFKMKNNRNSGHSAL